MEDCAKRSRGLDVLRGFETLRFTLRFVVIFKEAMFDIWFDFSRYE